MLAGFEVEIVGSISDTEILTLATPALDEAAVATVKKMPRWKPGMQDGKKVRAKFSVPITFRLK